MSLPAWPTCLPYPSLPGYGVIMSDDINARTTGNVGPIYSRNRHTRQIAYIPVSYLMDDIQLGIFEAWFHWILNDGHAWFTSIQSGEGLEVNTCRFDGGYSVATQSAGNFLVSGTLQIDNPFRG